jgi:rhomboid protease GluP
VDDKPQSQFELSEDDFLPAPAKPLSALATKPPVAFLTVPVCMALLFAVTSVAYWRDPRTYDFWVSKQSITVDGQYWRLFTALFTHSDFLHLLSNLPLFLIFGWYLRSFFGLRMFPIVALLAGIASNFLTVIFYAENTRLVGASGMLYAMVGLWLLYYVRFETVYKFWNKVMRATAFALVLLFPTTFQENVSYLAHFWGFVSGLVLGVLFLPITSVQLTVSNPEVPNEVSPTLH